MKYLRCSIIASLVLGSASLAVGAAQKVPLTPGASIELPHSTGKFDFLRIDPIRHRLLAAHENDGGADYFDLEKGLLIARLKVGGAVDHAVDSDSHFYYVSVQEAERVAVVDARTLKEVKSIKTPGPTDAILFEPNNHMVYVTNDNGANVWVIDPATTKVVATIVIPGVPEFMVYDAAADRIYLNIKTKDLVAVIDPSTNKVVGGWSTAPATQPHGLALDGANHRLFSAGANGKLVAIDTKTGAATGSIEIAAKVDQIALDETRGFLYCAGVGKMTVLQDAGGNLTLLGELSTAETARNVAVDSASGAIWTTFTDGKSSFAKSWVPSAAQSR